MEYNYNQIQNSNLDYLQVNEILNIQEAREYKIALAMLEKNALPSWINSPEMCLPIFDFARRIKMPFLSLVQNLYKVGDTITLTGKGMLAIIYSHGGEYRVLEEFEILCKEKDNLDARCTLEARRSKSDWTHIITCTIKEMRNLGLLERENWKRQAKNMLFWRTVSKMCRQVFTDYICGMYMPDEIDNTGLLYHDEFGNIKNIES